MKKHILKFGSVSGLILVAVQVITFIFMNSDSGAGMSEWLGYATMILALSIIFVGVKQYRDQYLGGIITFGKAFMIGIYMSLVASVFYVIGWMIISGWFVPDFIDQYAENYMKELVSSGAEADEVTKAEAQMDYYKRIYSNPILKAGITFTEIFPVALIMSLIGAFILKKK